MGIYATAGAAADSEIAVLTGELTAARVERDTLAETVVRVTGERDRLAAELADCRDGTTPPPTPAGMMVGSDPGTAGTAAALDTKYGGGGRKVPIRRFYTSFQAVKATDTDRPSCVSFKGHPANVINGSLDTAITTAANSCSKVHLTYFSYFHEPEDNTINSEFSSVAYRDAWQRIATLVRAVKNSKILLTPIWMGWSIVKASGRDWREWYPGDAYCDALGWDLDGVHPKNGVYPDWTEHLSKIPSLTSKPWIVAEWGAPRDAGDPDGTKRAAYYTTWVGKLRAAGCSALFLFDYPASNNAYPLTTHAEINAWKTLVAGNPG